MPWSILELVRNEPEVLKEHIKKRQLEPSIVDSAVALDSKWRAILTKINELRHRHNVVSSKITKARGEEKKKLIEEARSLKNKLEEAERELRAIEEERMKTLRSLPNIVEDDVPVGDEDASIPIRFWGKPKVYRGYVTSFEEQTEKYGFTPNYEVIDFKPVGHADMLENVLKLADTLKAGEVSSSRFYYLFDDIVWLDFSLLLFAIDRLTSKGYSLVLPPYMLRYGVINSVIDLETFKDAIYKIEGEDLYMIATAEHPIAALYYNEEIYDDELPKKYVGFSPAFRKEAGAGNRDLKGIFRVHQFHKVEQFVFSLPEESKKYHEEIIGNAEEIFRELGLPYRIVNIASGDLGACATKKYDLEVWMPSQGKFREMVSASNCTDWQAYRLNIRLIRRKGMVRDYVHTLNSTGIASTRVITAIMENYQLPDGSVVVPKVLRKYLEPFEKAPKEIIKPRKARP
ncbi:MAG: serine--tRNA ligase [Caldisphaeraceae archaeon]|nr:serine--tRNA ligase [Caldisphaeraceae archaeon]